jgi:GAF domain-containing protein
MDDKSMFSKVNIFEQIQQLRIKAQKYRVLHEIGREIAANDSLEGLLTRIVEGGVLIIKAEEGKLLIVEDETNDLYEVAYKSYSCPDVSLERVKVEDRILRSVLKSGNSISLGETELDTGQLAKGLLCVPLLARGKVIGALLVYNITKNRLFSNDDEYYLTSLANYAAIAIDNFKLLDKAKVLSSLSAISQSLLTTYDINNDLEYIVFEALRLLDADIVTLYRYKLDIDDVIIPPIIKGDLYQPDFLQIKGKLHRDAILFKLIGKREPFFAENARKDWINSGFYSVDSNQISDNFVEREKIASAAAIPLIINYVEPVGVLFINYRTPQKFSSEFRDKLNLFSNYAALIIHNLDVYNQSIDYANQLSVLSQIGQTISESAILNLDKICLLIYEQTSKVIDAYNFYIALYDDIKKIISFKIVVEDNTINNTGEGDWVSRNNGNGLTEYLIRNRKPLLLIRDIDSWFKDNEIEAIGKPAKSWLGAPMISRGKVIGAIAIQDYEYENKYSEQHKTILETIASQAAIAIDNSLLLQKLNDYIKGLEKLTHLSRGILAGEEISGILKFASRASCELTDANASAILLFRSPDKDNIYIESCWCGDLLLGMDKSQVIGYQVPLNSGVTGIVAHTKNPLIVSDVSLFDNYINLIPSTKSEIAVPLLRHKKIDDQSPSLLGVINVESDEINHFSEIHLDLLNKLGIQVAIALEQRQRIQELERVQRYLQDASSLANIGFVYGEDLHLANNRLGAARQYALDIIDSEDIRKMKDYARRIHRNIDEFLDLLDELREQVNPPSPEKFNIHELTRATAYSIDKSSLIIIQDHLDDKSPFVIGYKRQLGQVLRVVIFNAIDAMNGQGVLTLSSMELKKGDFDYLEIHIKDTGHGIPESLRPFIFTPGKALTHKRGIGMGLPWSSLIMRITGGDISYTTKIDKGTTMKILVPRDCRLKPYDDL